MTTPSLIPSPPPSTANSSTSAPASSSASTSTSPASAASTFASATSAPSTSSSNDHHNADKAANTSLGSKRPFSAVEGQEIDTSDNLLQRYLPTIDRQLKAMHQDLCNKLEAQRTMLATTNDLLSQLVSGTATLSVNLSFNNGNAPITTNSSPAPSSSLHQQQGPVHNNPPTYHQLEQPPLYTMNRAICTVHDLWREWYTGLPGGYAVSELEGKWGTKWRKDGKEKRFFNRRRLLIAAINDYAERENIPVETAVKLAEEKRVKLNVSLHHLASNHSKIFE